ncbi:RNA-binding cell elongation regulator Jag/EloR [Limosilactobacillus kribbianus]|uniref:RNA-binding cell elongation regulator Jag/EloR n=1 Tax=Limosilactobacillus kribbianus TaxID=2982695 RepID=UPI002265140B|nr:RNA-binding cell elongation regulator Jag/EloR [Limosilactobacillus kribbianus]
MPLYSGKTIDEAERKAASELGKPLEQLVVKVIQEPRRGFLGLGRRDAQISAEIKQPTPQPVSAANAQPKKHSAVKQSKNVSANPVTTARPRANRPAPHDGGAQDPAVIKARHAANLKRVQSAGKRLTGYLQDVFQALGVETTPQVKQVAAHEITVDIQSPASGRVIGHHGRRINAMEQLAAAFMDYHGAPKTAVILDTSDYRQRRHEALHELAERSVTEVVASGQAVFLDPMPARERKQLHRELENNTHVRTYSHGREPYRSVVIAPRN